MVTEISPFHKPLPSAAPAVNPPIRHPGIKSLYALSYASFYQHSNRHLWSIIDKALQPSGLHRAMTVNTPGYAC